MTEAPAPDRSYDVIALSFPIVYALEGDHDPNGMLYTLRVYERLLEWVKDQWKDHDEYLPRLHRKMQLMQVVVDGLPRYHQMRARLQAGDESDHELLHELGGEEELLHRHEKDACSSRSDPHAKATRQNYRATVDDLVTALTELTRGDVTRLSANPQVRQDWLEHWQLQLKEAEEAMAARLHEIDRQFECLVKKYPEDSKNSQDGQGLTQAHVRRLLLNDHNFDARKLGSAAPPYNRCNPLKPLPLARPLVLRACQGETVEVRFENKIRRRRVGMHLQGEGLGGDFPATGFGVGVRHGDGAAVGANQPSLADRSRTNANRGTYYWRNVQEGVWPINDVADVRGTQNGTNAHGLFAALVVESKGAQWYDPETGELLGGTDHADGLYVDVVPEDEQPLKANDDTPALCPEPAEHRCTADKRCRRWREENFVDFHQPDGTPHAEAGRCSFREFTIFFHDEPENHSGLHLSGEHSVMPLSYRAEPMHNRLPHRMRRYAQATAQKPLPTPGKIDHSAVKIELNEVLGERFWIARDEHGNFLEQVSGEEQHHSSWLFGELVTPLLRAYKGDPSRIRLVHAGVKETHVFHLHVHQWRAVAQDTAVPSTWQDGQRRGSQLLDSITIGPQTGMTIDPLYGSGSRQRAVGDIIWHCHLYPHFHHGMWGMWRSFDRLVTGRPAYPDGTPCPALRPLPGRVPETPTTQRPGFPWFIDATFPQKSPPPPSPHQDDVDAAAAVAGAPVRPVPVDGRRQLLGMPRCSEKERAAFAPACRDGSQPGALFVDLDGPARTWNALAEVPEQRIISYDVEATASRVEYNSRGWHDARGHHYKLTGITVTTLDPQGRRTATQHFDPPATAPGQPVEAFFPRANHGDIVEWRFHNKLTSFPADDFDLPADPVECGLHVHLVKFDVLAADGSATGWNYLSGASTTEAVGPNLAVRPERNVSLHRWVVDEEFGPCFFHDHLLAMYRQKHGLSAALIAEPTGSRWYLPDQKTTAWAGTQAVVFPDAIPALKDGKPCTGLPPFREACLNVGDFIPLYRAPGAPLNIPNELGGDDDPGAMGVNYRCAPLTHRGDDPSEWFSSSESSPFDEEADAKAAALRGEELPAAEAEVEPLPDPGQPHKDRRDPDTPVIWTYPGERLRIRLIQGSHEEQHSFVIHGMRWRKDWHNPASPLVNQQTIGISEVFTVEIDPQNSSRYGAGDHLWQFAAMDDLWLGCWGLVRALRPNRSILQVLPPLPPRPLDGDRSAPITPAQMRPAVEAIRAARPTPNRPHRNDDKIWDQPVREYVVVARRAEHQYTGRALTDPWGLIYERAASCEEEVVFSTKRKKTKDPCTPQEEVQWHRTGNRRAVGIDHTGEPLVLRARRGEWIKITLINEVLLPDEEDPTPEEVQLVKKRHYKIPEGIDVQAFAKELQRTVGRLQQLPLADPLLPRFGPEVSPPPLPIEHTDEMGYPDQRTVSPRVSLHPSLLAYDVVTDDGAYVGHNHDGTVAALDVGEGTHSGGGHIETGSVIYRENHGIGHRDPNWREYWWYADPDLAPKTCAEGPGQVCYLQDMGDVRNHRHHGLIGALIVEPGDAAVTRRPKQKPACHPEELELGEREDAGTGTDTDQQPVPGDEEAWNWSGTHAQIRCANTDAPATEEIVVFLQDGLRHFLYGDPDRPIRDVVPGDDPEDAGQKGINYRTALVTNNRNPLGDQTPPTPIFPVPLGGKVWLRLVCGGDKPRNHTFTLHGLAWDAAPWVSGRQRAGAVNGISAGFADNIVIEPKEPGDHAYRNGVFKWAVSQGMWGILRVEP
jgi:hypothetical protein